MVVNSHKFTMNISGVNREYLKSVAY